MVLTFICSQVDSVDQSLLLLVTEKRERDVLGQIVVPLSDVDDSCSTEPMTVPLQPGLQCPDLLPSPGELIYSVWITTRDHTAESEDRSLTSRTTASLSRLRRKLNSSPVASSASRWNDFKTSRSHSVNAFLELRSGDSPDFCHISLEDDSSPATPGEVFMPISSPDGYIKRSTLPTMSEYYFPRPQILEVCPSESPTTGGTVVTVRGRDLGLSRDDVVELLICGSDVVDSVRYISSERLVCTTSAWRPCVGSVTVETTSGGRVSSAAQFTFVAGSDPPAPRVSVQPTSEVQTRPSRRRRSLSLSALETIEKPQKTVTTGALRCQKSQELATADVTMVLERCSSVFEIQPTRTYLHDVIHPPGTSPQVKDDLCWKLNNEKVLLYCFSFGSLPFCKM